MKKIIVDASVVLAWFLPDESRDARVLSLLESCKKGDVQLSAPSILPYEVLNGLLIASRRGRVGAEIGYESYQAFLALGIEIIEIRDDGPNVLATAMASGLAAYDAAYVFLASKECAELATLDKQLADKARTMGIGLYGV